MKKDIKRIIAAILGSVVFVSSIVTPLCASEGTDVNVQSENMISVDTEEKFDTAQVSDIIPVCEEETIESSSESEEEIVEEIAFENETSVNEMTPDEESLKEEPLADEVVLTVEDISTADGIMPMAEETSEGVILLDRKELIMKSTRAITLKTTMEPYVYEKHHLTCKSSDETVVSIEKVDDPLSGIPGKIKLRAVDTGEAQIIVKADGYTSAVCQVTVTDESSTWHKSLSDVEKMSVDDVIQMDVYDGRDLDIMTPVNTQIGGICVVEGHIAAMETSLVKQRILDKSAADMHERNLVYHFFNHNGDPLGNTDEDRQSTSDWNYRGASCIIQT